MVCESREFHGDWIHTSRKRQEEVDTPQQISLLGFSPVVTPILGCNMAILVAIWINCIYVWSLIGGCIWNGAIGSCILLDVVLQYGGFAMHVEKLMQP